MDTAIFFWTLTLDLLGRSRASLHFKTERIAETALRVSSFWQPLSPFSRTYRIRSSPMDSNLTSARLCLQWNWHRKTFWTLIFELLDRNIALLHFKTERVAETALRASWFWPTSSKFPGIWGIFSSPGESKLTPDGHALQWNLHSTSFCTHTFEVLDRNTAPLYLQTKRVAETDLRASWFWATSARFAGT